jgi:hypothetical protein
MIRESSLSATGCYIFRSARSSNIRHQVPVLSSGTVGQFIRARRSASKQWSCCDFVAFPPRPGRLSKSLVRYTLRNKPTCLADRSRTNHLYRLAHLQRRTGQIESAAVRHGRDFAHQPGVQGQGAADPVHDSLGRMARAIPSSIRSNDDTLRSSCFRPAGVIL